MRKLTLVALLCSALMTCLVCGAWSFDNCSRYGVVDQWGTDGSGTDPMSLKMTALGCKYIRAAWNWDQIEGPGDNNYDPYYLGLMDNFVTTMNTLGVKVYYNFNYTPAWARSGGSGATPPTDPTRYTDFITFMVNRYKNQGVKDWGFWNEPNLGMFYNGNFNTYVQTLLIPGIQAVKAADPTAKCCVGELSSAGDDVSLMRSMLQAIDAAGLHSSVDVITTHQYDGGDNYTGRLADIDTMHNNIVSIGWADKDFWITETGLMTSNGQNETTQNTMLQGFMQGMDARRSWWKKTFWFTLSEGAAGQWGLLRPDLSQKPSYNTYQSYISAHSGDQWPFGNGGVARAIPGTIQAEDYDQGCEGVSYHDTDNINSGAVYRTEGVDVETCAEGGYDIGWFNTGEWLEWTVNVATAGTYNMNVRVASPNSGRLFHIEMNGNNVTGARTVTNTGGFQNWATVTASVTLSAGTQIMRLVADTGDWNVNYIDISQSGVDTTAPTFGGSINPSTVSVLTPTITITGQDTGSGLNVGSADFAYSVDGGTSFGSYVGRYVLHSKGTGSGGGNRYWYPDFYHPSYTIASGDHLQYDIYSNNSDGTGAIDLEGGLGNLRDSGILDQNGLSGHPNTNLYSRDYHQWYHRDFTLTSKAGQTITDFEAGHETDSGVSEYYVRNVIITNNGLVKLKAADADSWTAVSDTIGPGTAGYGTLVGPEMLTSDPSTPASCTGSNGTTAQQTVSAVFSGGMSPLVTGSNNRIKYRISDMSANRATSSTFTITVNSSGQTPYAGVIALPGTIQAENYDNGGEGVAYHDLTSGNSGGVYRSDNVDIGGCSDTGGGYTVGWIDTGEWLEYTVSNAAAGDYDFYVRVSSPNAGSSFKILIDGTDVTGTRSFPTTGSWDTWTTIIVPSRYLAAGQHVLQFNVVSGGFNFNKIDVYNRNADAVSVDLGNPDYVDGLSLVTGVGDGDTVPWSVAGHNCRENIDVADTYMYFAVNDGWALNGNKQNVYITFDYYDLGSGTLGLNYDAVGNQWAFVAGPALTNTGTWKQYTFHVTNAYFGNRENGGADFRICGVAAEWGLDTVCVYQ